MTTNEVLHDSRISRLIELALLEDVGMGDVTTDAIVPEQQIGEAHLVCKDDGVIAGLEVAALVFQHCDASVTMSPVVPDGGTVKPGDVISIIHGSVAGILRAERTALNFLQRMSGIATLTRTFVDTVAGTGARITDTRKTVPALRVLDKWAVRLGGGINHRFGLDDMFLIKDNHIAAAGSISKAVESCQKYAKATGIAAAIEIETRTLEEVREALACPGIHRIMLDNFAVQEMREAVEFIAKKVEVEASGGVTLENVRAIADTGVDFISVGSLTHSVRALDISLEITHASP